MQVRDCLQRAEECGQQAKLQRDPKLAGDYLDLERRWLRLARSCQLAEQLESFTSHKATAERNLGPTNAQP
jgi:hypothetical protein